MIEDMDNQAATLRELARAQASAKPGVARADGTPRPLPARRLTHRKAPATLAVTSGKGGVGKTLVTVNLAVNFAKMGMKVLVIDADLGLANVDVVLGLTPEHTIQDFLSGEMDLAEVALAGPLGITILPAASGVAELSTLNEAQRLLLMDSIDHWNADFDVVLVDTGAGISSNVRYFVLAVEQILVVSTPDPASITDAYALMKVMYLNHRMSRFDLLVNQVKSEREALEVYKALQRVADRFLNIGLDYVGYVPSDPQLTLAIRRQRPVAELFPTAPASLAFEKVAAFLRRRSELRDQDDGQVHFFGRRSFSQ